MTDNIHYPKRAIIQLLFVPFLWFLNNLIDHIYGNCIKQKYCKTAHMLKLINLMSLVLIGQIIGYLVVTVYQQITK